MDSDKEIAVLISTIGTIPEEDDEKGRERELDGAASQQESVARFGSPGRALNAGALIEDRLKASISMGAAAPASVSFPVSPSSTVQLQPHSRSWDSNSNGRQQPVATADAVMSAATIGAAVVATDAAATSTQRVANPNSNPNPNRVILEPLRARPSIALPTNLDATRPQFPEWHK